MHHRKYAVLKCTHLKIVQKRDNNKITAITCCFLMSKISLWIQ